MANGAMTTKDDNQTILRTKLRRPRVPADVVQRAASESGAG